MILTKVIMTLIRAKTTLCVYKSQTACENYNLRVEITLVCVRVKITLRVEITLIFL
jgi:hypothetical protein